MEILLALVAVVAVLALARRGFLHPLDYLVAAGIAVMLGIAVFVAIPSEDVVHVMVQYGTPRPELARSDFLMAHGVKIVLALFLFALGGSYGALVRRRATPEQFA